MKKIWIWCKSSRLSLLLIILTIINVSVITLKDNTNTPVEEFTNSRVDSLDAVNDSLKNELTNIDSITNEKIIESNNLNDSDAVSLLEWLLHGVGR